MPTYVIACKARPPVEGADVIDQQIRAAHAYHNRLVELHRAMADALDDAKRRHCPALGPAEEAVGAREAELLDLLARIKAANAREKRKRPTPEDQSAAALARQALRDARAEVKARRAEAVADAAYQSAVERIVAEYNGTLPTPDAARREGGHLKAARENCGVYWGTYQHVEQAVEASRNESFGRPEFWRWDGGGVVATHFQGALPTFAEVRAGNSQARIVTRPSPPRHRNEWVTFHVRIQSAGGAPVWAVLNGEISKGQIPDDARLVWVKIVRRQLSVRKRRDPDVPEGVWRPYYEWTVHLTIRTGRTKDRAAAGAAGVNLGWRAMDDGSLRVAYVAGADGRAEDVRLPAALVGSFAKAEELRAIRDLRFNQMRDELAAWLRDHPHPDWLREATAGLGQWRSCRRLGGLVGLWARNRFAGDEPYGLLVVWRTKDIHLEQWELSQRKKNGRRRLAYYRQVAARLRQTYRTIAVEDTDYRTLKARPKADSAETVNETAKYNLGVAAPGLLRQLLVQGGARAVSAEGITRACHRCGHVNEWDRAAALWHQCEGCGAEWDQDHNAALNLLASARVMDESPAPARDPDPPAGDGDGTGEAQPRGRWARRKAARSRKAAEQATESGVSPPAPTTPVHGA